MRIIIVGGCGTVGTKLKVKWPHAVCVDRVQGADVVCDLATLEVGDCVLLALLKTAEVVIHLATSPDPEAPEAVHFEAVVNTAKLVSACAAARVPKLVLASSDWAEPKAANLKINAYGYSKRVIEAMAEMYSRQEDRIATAIRIGWIPDASTRIEEAPEWLLEAHWSDAKLISEFAKIIER